MMNEKPQFLEDIQIGQGSECHFTVTDDMIMKFADLSGDHNPIHVDEEFAKTTPYKGRIAHGMLGGAFISATLARALPGAVYVSQALSFKRPMRIDDQLKVTISVTDIDLKSQRVFISTRVLNEKNKIIMDGEAVAMVSRRPQ
jgi:3-hydroxybutyryl-CoA dehydratase